MLQPNKNKVKIDLKENIIKNKSIDDRIDNRDIYVKRFMKEKDNERSDKNELYTKGRIDNPKSIYYSSSKNELDNKKKELIQDNYSKEDRELYERKGSGKQNLLKIKEGIKTAASVAELGAFVPLPQAQAVAKIGSLVSGAINAGEAIDDLRNGDYNSAALNGSQILLSSIAGLNSFKRNSKYSRLANALDPGLSKGRTAYLNLANQVKKQSKLQLGVNRAVLAGILGESGYNAKSFAEKMNE